MCTTVGVLDVIFILLHNAHYTGVNDALAKFLVVRWVTAPTVKSQQNTPADFQKDDEDYVDDHDYEVDEDDVDDEDDADDCDEGIQFQTEAQHLHQRTFITLD